MRWRLPRRLHAGAWWLWAIGLIAAATQTTNPLLLGLIVGAASMVVAARRSTASWARGYRTYLILALVVVGIRMLFRILLGGDFGSHVLIALPQLALPDWAGGVAVGGPVTAEELLAGFYDGLRLATVIVCVGAANTLADPRRLVRAVPRGLGRLATSLVVALSLAPQLVETVIRVSRARRLRGETGKDLRSLRLLLVPILEDAMDRSLALGASMDSRGFGQVRAEARPGRGWRQAIAWIGLGIATVGLFQLLSGGPSPILAGTTLAFGLATAAVSLAIGHQDLKLTRYRPDPWEAPEWLVAGSGVAAALGVYLVGTTAPSALTPTLDPLTWPVANLGAMASILLAALPAWAAPPVDGPRPRPGLPRMEEELVS